MGDKSPKQKNKNKAQKAAQRSAAKQHVAGKQAKAEPAPLDTNGNGAPETARR